MSETHIIGRRCREWLVPSDVAEPLARRGILLVGRSRLLPPYRMVRLNPDFSHIVACHGGSGWAWIAGRWVRWREGQVLLAPPGAYHAFEARENRPWLTSWIFYRQTPGAEPVVALPAPVLVEADAAAFTDSVQVLARETGALAEAPAVLAAATLTDLYARRLAGPSRREDERLRRVWRQVDANPARPWNNAELARLACVSPEHLRRLCRQTYGTTPMARVRELRLQRACALLTSGLRKLGAVAEEVGFSSLFSFSAAFKRWSGMSPSSYVAGR